MRLLVRKLGQITAGQDSLQVSWLAAKRYATSAEVIWLLVKTSWSGPGRPAARPRWQPASVCPVRSPSGSRPTARPLAPSSRPAEKSVHLRRGVVGQGRVRCCCRVAVGRDTQRVVAIRERSRQMQVREDCVEGALERVRTSVLLSRSVTETDSPSRAVALICRLYRSSVPLAPRCSRPAAPSRGPRASRRWPAQQREEPPDAGCERRCFRERAPNS